MSCRKIELCLASPVLYPPRGGAEIRFLSYLSGLRQRDINVSLLTGTPKAKKITEQDRTQEWYQYSPGSIIPTDPLNGCPIHRVRLPNKSGWRRAALFNQTMLRYCRQTEHKPDIIQLIDPLSPIATPWLFKLKTFGIARVFAYTLPYELPNHPFRRALRRNALRLLHNQLDCVLTGSEATKAHARNIGLGARTEVIPNGVNLQRFQPVSIDAKRTLRASLGLGEVSKIITSVGSIIPRKGIDLLLEAWIPLAKRFKDLHLVLIGPRIDEQDPKLSSFHRKLVELANASGAGGRIHFTGQVSNVDAYLQASDLFVFASEREGMANVVLEAMASGLPVIMTPHIGLPPDFGKHAEQYLLTERTPQAVAEAVTALLENKILFDALASSGRRWVEETMNLDSVLDRYAALYHELCCDANR